jgi:8-amino-7-oxononanoate synthase
MNSIQPKICNLPFNYMMKSHEQILREQLTERKQNGLIRSLNVMDQLADFCSNDYLGLAKNQSLAIQIETDFNLLKPNFQTFYGSTGSRLISGHSLLFEQFEKKCAAFHQADAALLFSSGYDANVGLLSAITQPGQVVFCDQLLHASLIDGLRLGKAERKIFKHNDLADLENLLSEYPIETPKWIVVESLYSMDGDVAPMRELVHLKNKYKAEIIFDEAHAGGIYGPIGNGLAVEMGIEKELFARVITFGKAWGNAGAVVLGSQTLIDFLINFSRPFIYSTAPSPHHVFSLSTTLDFLKTQNGLREKLKDNIDFFIQHTKSSHWGSSKTAIQTFFIAGNLAVKKKASELQEKGFAVKAIVYPTVPKGEERIRITLNSLTKKEAILALIKNMETHE